MGLYGTSQIDASTQGQEFGNWTQLGPSFITAYGNRRERMAVFQCECGEICGLLYHNVRSLKSGGCTKCRAKNNGDKCRRHGMSHTRVHNIWWGMITRCTNPNVACWKDYGGRGIQVCERWRVFENFLADMGEPPDGQEIDRIDVNGNYEPENCRWTTIKEQTRNTRKTRRFMYQGQMRSLPEIADLAGLSRRLLYGRLVTKGWSFDRAIGTPSKVL